MNGFASQKWPDHSLADVKFPSAWRKRPAKAAIRITTVEQLRKKLHPLCHLRFSSLEQCAQELVNIITSTTLANSSNLPQNLPENMLQPTGLATTPTRTSPQAEPPDASLDIPPTPETFPLANAPRPTTLGSAPDAPQPITPAGAPVSTLTPETLFFANAT